MDVRGTALTAIRIRSLRLAACVALMILPVAIWPGFFWEGFKFSILGLVAVSPLVVPGIALTAWIIASGADNKIRLAFEGNHGRSILMASLIGAITPVCGVTVLPLMAGLLGAGVPLAPVMAFWLSSPITDPAMLATTAATLGMPFAIGKTLAAFGMGLLGGFVTSLVFRKQSGITALRSNRLTVSSSACACGQDNGFNPYVWQDSERTTVLKRQAYSTTRLILICLIPAFFAEYALNTALTPGALATYVGNDNWWSIPMAVFVGAPAYIDGYAALPLTRALLDNGMAAGAAMAFLVAGGVVSIWGALAIFPVLRLKPFLLYLVLAVIGSLLSGYLFEWYFRTA
ncbi:permease [Roseibium album]|uniref:permease n=1 Tax=Roseibium album TaxID=311410 RepID=UPI003BAF442C